MIDRMIVAMLKLTLYYLCLIIGTALLLGLASQITAVWSVLLPMMPLFFLSQSLAYVLTGPALGLFVTGIVLVFGWLQLLLIASGKIAPHLSDEGFITAFKSIVSTLYKPT